MEYSHFSVMFYMSIYCLFVCSPIQLPRRLKIVCSINFVPLLECSFAQLCMADFLCVLAYIYMLKAEHLFRSIDDPYLFFFCPNKKICNVCVLALIHGLYFRALHVSHVSYL